VGLSPSFAAMEAGLVGNTPRRRSELDGGVDGDSTVEPLVLGVGG
jgi:hypothetical protein